MPASPTPDGPYVNVRSGECAAESSAAVTERGLRIVMYRGESYLVVGMYFARSHDGRRELRYILAPTQQRSAPLGDALTHKRGSPCPDGKHD